MKQISLKLKVSTADEHVSGSLCKLEPQSKTIGVDSLANYNPHKYSIICRLFSQLPQQLKHSVFLRKVGLLLSPPLEQNCNL